MFATTRLQSRRLTPLPLLLLFLAAVTLAPATFAQSIQKPVHWSAGPLVNDQGVPLPPAATYEVWVVEDSQPDYLSRTVADTTCVLTMVLGVSYRVRVRGVSSGGLQSAFSAYSDPYRPVRPSPATVQRGPGGNTAAPNPFTDRTVISFVVPESLAAGATLSLEIYDLRGHRLQRFDVTREPGAHGVTWNGRDAHGARMPSGVYLARFRCGAITTNVKLTLIP